MKKTKLRKTKIHSAINRLGRMGNSTGSQASAGGGEYYGQHDQSAQEDLNK